MESGGTEVDSVFVLIAAMCARSAVHIISYNFTEKHRFFFFCVAFLFYHTLCLSTFLYFFSH